MLAAINNSLDRSTKSTPSPPKGLRLLVRTQFQVLFHSHSWVLLTFPSRYLFSIDHTIYLALGGGPPRFSQGFTCPDLLDKTNIRLAKLCVPGYHCLWRSFPTASARIADLLDLMQTNGRICFRYGNLICISAPYWSFVMSQPLLDIRLPTYLSTSKLANKNLKSLGCSAFARHY